jgi:hypothetical protein
MIRSRFLFISAALGLLLAPFAHADKWAWCATVWPESRARVTNYMSDACEPNEDVSPDKVNDAFGAYVKAHYDAPYSEAKCSFGLPFKEDASTARDESASRFKRTGHTVVFTHWTY